MIEYGLLGEKLGHSFSPQLHKALAGYNYGLLPTPPGQVEELFRRREFKGLNVTIPYKRTVIPLCDQVDPRAAAIGAVNTVVNRDGTLIGCNTDIDGLIDLARRAGICLPIPQLHAQAIQWELRHGGRTPRTAQQFIASLNLPSSGAEAGL